MLNLSLPAEAAGPDPHHFRNVIGSFVTGIAIVTTSVDGEHYGMTINSLTSVSLDPCMLLVCPRRASRTGAALQKRGEFAVNILADTQRELSRRFVNAITQRFDGLELEFSGGGMPLLPGAVAHICCRVAAVHPAGDHNIVLGEVLACSDGQGHPLVFHKGAFGGFRGGD
jgi:3-hydroxy-9,10-secoandrosta-1,3,5(10)-triene-9,17-dione monooxygenase reductase component